MVLQAITNTYAWMEGFAVGGGGGENGVLTLLHWALCRWPSLWQNWPSSAESGLAERCGRGCGKSLPLQLVHCTFPS